MIIIIASIFFLDRLLKYLFLQSGSVIINEGVIFGISTGLGHLEIYIQIIVTLMILIFLLVEKNYKYLKIPLVLIFTGSLSNIIDRIVYNGVLDYIRIGKFPVFNFADVMIVGGVLLILYKEFEQHVRNNHSRSK